MHADWSMLYTQWVCRCLTYDVQGKDNGGLFIWIPQGFFLSLTMCTEFQTIFSYSNSQQNFVFLNDIFIFSYTRWKIWLTTSYKRKAYFTPNRYFFGKPLHLIKALKLYIFRGDELKTTNNVPAVSGYCYVQT